MRIPDEIRKAVVFVGYRLASGERHLRGTGFFVVLDDPKKGYLVTAKHVIDKIRALGIDQVQVRLNRKDGTAAWISYPISAWKMHRSDPTIDVAYVETSIAANADHLAIPRNFIATDKVILENEVGLGDEVFVSGLFTHHHGRERNIPIVRTGNIASNDEEKVVTKLGEMDAFLIEARSIGGLSGSPVFVNLGNVRLVGRQLKQSTQGAAVVFLVGLIHGHFDVRESEVDCSAIDSISPKPSADHVNTGIGIVVPVKKILETIESNF